MSGLLFLHPAVAAFYFVSVLLITMFTAHPLVLLFALLGGVLFLMAAGRPAHPLRDCGFYLLVFALVTLTNPLFSHHGVTPLFFLNGNPVTLEALLYGGAMAMTVIAVLVWFRNFHLVLTADKLLFLLGKLSAKIALLLSGALRFVPLLKTRAGGIRRAQRAMGLYASDTWTDKLKGTARVCSALITWSLESAIDTGSSMKARGYGLKGRSHYALYRFRRGDALFLAVVAALDAVVLAVMATGRLAFAFYPSVSVKAADGYTWAALGAFALLSLLPFILELKEGLQWSYYRSKM